MTGSATRKPPRLKLLPRKQYLFEDGKDPLPYYYWPVLGKLYRRRVELCLQECVGGQRVLEVGYGSGVTFLNLGEKYKEIHGIDLSANTSEVSRRFAAQGLDVRLCNGDVTKMPYTDGYFDTVLLISILEHLKPAQLQAACREIARGLKPGGQIVYGVPVERAFMVFMFRVLGYNIREHHFSTEKDVNNAFAQSFKQIRLVPMKSLIPALGALYEVGHFLKAA